MIRLSDEHRLIRETVCDLVEKEIFPKAAEIDSEHRFPKEIIKLLGKQGYMGVNVPAELGGSEMDYLSYALIVEEISRGCASTGVIVSVNNSLAISPILHFGNEEQKSKWIPALARGEKLGCFSLSEPIAGSDAGSIKCQSMRDGDDFVINGVKNWVTNGKEADIVLLFATEDPSKKHKGLSCFVIEKESEGLTIGKNEKKLGILGTSTTELIFENCRIQADQRIGDAGEGFKIAMHSLDGGRLGIAAQAVGIARDAFEKSVKYSLQRETMGKKIADHQATQLKVADMVTRIEASQAILYNASALKDEGINYTKESAMAKLIASETAMWVATQAIQIHGGYGYTREFSVERNFRDAKITEIYEGTSEVQRLVIASKAFKEMGN